MLSEIYIENLAVIQKAVIPLCNGLNIFTGETGAGKSILINGINAVLGQRITKDIVRTGADKATIVALFTDISERTKNKLNEFGIDYDENEITVSREISADGGSVARVNGRTSTVTVLKELGETLINIHGQHDNQILLSPERHLEILDGYAELGNLLNDYRECFRELQKTARNIKKLAIDENARLIRVAELTQTVREISELEIEDGEDEEIEEEYKIAKNAENIINSLETAKVLLSSYDTDEPSVSDMLQVSIDELSSVGDIMEKINPLTERLISAKIEVTDIYEELSSISDSIDIDSERLAYITDRRESLINIKRKYGPELKDVIDTLTKSSDELNKLQSSDSELEKMKSEKNRLLSEATAKAKRLSKAREEAGGRFILQVAKELEFLDMPNVKLAIKHEKGKLTSTGMDSIEIMISANLGETPKSISKIASGGELSRIMLALKSVIAGKDDIPTMIFDEIDTGVSGRAAQKIGIKLDAIGKMRQVICVTHLAQIAVMADNHLMIEKKNENNRTVTTVKRLDLEGRKHEIARIIGGDDINELTLRNAEQMIKKK